MPAPVLSTLFLIRHSLPVLDQSLPASQWRLTPEGRQRALHLAERLAGRGITLVMSSHEPKAVQTAEIIAAHCRIPMDQADNLHEHERPLAGFSSQVEFEAIVYEFYANPARLIFGNETADQAYIRFSAAVDGLLHSYPGETLAVVSHGTVMTLFVSRRCGIEPFPFWRSLQMPDCIPLSLPGYCLGEKITAQVPES